MIYYKRKKIPRWKLGNANWAAFQEINRVWDTGQLPSVWKQAVIVLKPGKDPADTSSYIPVAFISHLCKIMERMVTESLTYFQESKM